MFTTKLFSIDDLSRNLLDPWLHSFAKSEYGMMIVGYATLGHYLVVTVKQWKRSENPNLSHSRTTIDEIPQEPTIHYPEGDLPGSDI